MKYIAGKLRGSITLVKNVEIEIDDYRSYHRDKRSSKDKAK
jgi:hypothetical protein